MAQFSCSNFLISSAYIFLLKRNFFVCLWSSWLDHKCHVFLPFASKNYQSSGCLMSDDLVLVVDRSATISTVFMNVKLILFPDLTRYVFLSVHLGRPRQPIWTNCQGQIAGLQAHRGISISRQYSFTIQKETQHL